MSWSRSSNLARVVRYWESRRGGGRVAAARLGGAGGARLLRERCRSESRTVMFVGSQRGGEIKSVCASSAEKPHPPGP